MLSLVWKSLRNRPLRTGIALLQAFLGALVVALALALAFSQDRAANTSTDVAQINAGKHTKNSTTIYSMFAASDLPKLQKLAPDVQLLDVIGQDWVSGLEAGTTRYKLADSRTTGPYYPELTGLKVLYGSYFGAKDVAAGAKVLALSSNAARAIYGRENAVGETLGLINGPPGSKSVPYRVVAITEATRQNSQGPASPLLKPAVSSPYNKAGTLLVRARPGRLSQAKAQLLSAARSLYKNDPQIKSQGGGFYFTPVGNPFDSGSTGVNTTLRAFFAIAALTLTVSSLGVLASLLVSVGERTRELGLRRAIGATRGQIVQTLLLEAALTTLLGGLLGVLLAVLLAPALNTLFGSLLSGAVLAVSPALAAGVLGLFLGLSLLFGLVPALLGTRMRPTEALRMQG